MSTGERLGIGSSAWIPANCTQARYQIPGELMFGNAKPVWLPVQVISFEADGKSAIFTLEWDPSIKIKAQIKDCVARENVENIDDLSNLNNVSEASVMSQLCRRYVNHNFFTAIGRSTYISLNPIHQLVRQLGGHRNDAAQMFMYLDKTTKQPSIYYIADKAYRSAVEDMMSETIVMRGCSGSGKTENLKHIVQYLFTADQLSRTPRAVDFPTYEPLGTVFNPFMFVDTPFAKGTAAWLAVMDCFGSAQTERNENSSRHTKLLRFHYGSGLKLLSCLFYIK